MAYTRLPTTGWFGGPDHSVWPAKLGGYRGSLTTTRNDSDRPLIRARSVDQLWVWSHVISDCLMATHTRLSITFVIIGSDGSFPLVAGRPVRCSCGWRLTTTAAQSPNQMGRICGRSVAVDLTPIPPRKQRLLRGLVADFSPPEMKSVFRAVSMAQSGRNLQRQCGVVLPLQSRDDFTCFRG